MAKKKKDAETGEQLELIEVAPENQKKIKAVAKQYKAAQYERTTALAEEIKMKNKLLELIHEANLQPLEDGKIRFQCNGMVITVTPRDELIRVKEDGEGDE
jgi:serine/threonine protein phosphatase PrpC